MATHTKPGRDDVVTSIKSMKVRELSGLITALEKALGFSARSRVVVQPKPIVVPKPTEVSVILTGWHEERKLPLIRTLRKELGLGLREARDLVQAAPVSVREGADPAAAAALAEKLREAGGLIEIT